MTGKALRILLLAPALAALVSCGGKLNDSGWFTPAHLEHTYASISVPAGLDGGGRLVANGNLLLHYHNGLLVEEEYLLPELTHAASIKSSELVVNKANHIYLTMCGEAVRRYDSNGEMLWSVDMPVEAALPLPDGVLVYARSLAGSTATVLGSDGAVSWTVDGADFNRLKVDAAQSGQTYFVTERKILRSFAPDGQELWSYSVGDLYAIDIVGCSDDLVVIEDCKHLIGLSSDGSELWTIPVKGDSTAFEDGVVMGGGRTVVNVRGRYDGEGRRLVVYDRQGNELHSRSGLRLAVPVALNDGSFVALSYSDGKTYVTAYEVDNLERLWEFELPKSDRVQIEQGDVVKSYPWNSHPQVRGDRIHMGANGVMIILNTDGDLVESIAARSFVESWVPAIHAI